MTRITDDRLDIIIDKLNRNKHIIPNSYCNCYTRDTLSVFEGDHNDIIIKYELYPAIYSVYIFENKNIKNMCVKNKNIYQYLYSAATNQFGSTIKKPKHKIVIAYDKDTDIDYEMEDIIDEE